MSRPVLRRQLAAAAAAAAVLLLGAGTAGVAGAATPGPGMAVPALPVSVALTSLAPRAPQPGDVLRLRGTLHNDSQVAVDNLDVQFRYRPSRIGSRSEFDDYARGTGGPPDAGGSPLPLPPVTVTTTAPPLLTRTLAPGGSAGFDVRVRVDDLHLDQGWQVYEIGVQVNGTTPALGTTAVGGLRTFLPWAPVDANGNGQGVGVPVQVAWIWPLVDRPHRSVGTTWLDDDLARSISGGGRLATLLGAGVRAQDQPPTAAPNAGKGKKAKRPVHRVVPQPVPVTWAVDPLLAEDVSLMRDGYRIGTGRSAKAGSGAAAARAWLASLRSVVARGQALALPYADPDVVAAVRNLKLAPEVQVAIHSGETLLSDLLSTTPLSYAWPPGGLVDQHTLDTLFGAGVDTVVLDSRALPPVTEPPFTPGAHATARARDGNLDALLTDTGLDTVIGIGLEDPTKQPLALQRYAAELLLIQAELPNQQRTIVVAPDRRWAPSATYAQDLLTATGQVPWVHPVPLSAALSDVTSTTVMRQPLAYPVDARRAELPRRYVGDVLTLKESADTFASILPNPGDVHARAFDDAVLRTMSSAWRGTPGPRTDYRTAVDAQITATRNKVRITSARNSFVTLTSHSGTVPVTVSNELDTPVRVLVQIESQHLRVSGGRTAETIPPHRQIAVDVRADARTSGVFPLTVRLLTPSGRLYDSTGLLVRSTAYGSVAILITAGATGVLLLAVVIRLIRRGIAARRSSVTAA